MRFLDDQRRWFLSGIALNTYFKRNPVRLGVRGHQEMLEKMRATKITTTSADGRSKKTHGDLSSLEKRLKIPPMKHVDPDDLYFQQMTTAAYMVSTDRGRGFSRHYWVCVFGLRKKTKFKPAKKVLNWFVTCSCEAASMYASPIPEGFMGSTSGGLTKALTNGVVKLTKNVPDPTESDSYWSEDGRTRVGKSAEQRAFEESWNSHNKSHDNNKEALKKAKRDVKDASDKRMSYFAVQVETLERRTNGKDEYFKTAKVRIGPAKSDFCGQGASVDVRLIKDPFDSEILGKAISMQLDLPPDFSNREHLVNLYYPRDLGSDAQIDFDASWKEHGGVEKEFAMSGVKVGPG